MMKKYDVIILGGGPAGLTAGIYASRAGLDCLVIEKGIFGGLITEAEVVENYPGFPEGISGLELGDLLHRQAVLHGVDTLIAEFMAFDVERDNKIVHTNEDDFIARAIIIALGSERKTLGVKGETELLGHGVSYCATCDAAFFRDQLVAVVGGGDVAVTEALHLTKFASKVVIIHRRDQLRATYVLQRKAFAQSKIEILWDTVVDSIEGIEQVKELKLKNLKTNQKSSLELDGVFISVGFKPNSDYFKVQLSLDSSGLIITDNRMETNLPGIFAAGDIRFGSTWQAISAAGDGATAAINAERYLSKLS